MSLENCNDQIKNLLKKNKIDENKLLKTFLEDEENFLLFENAVLNPTIENRKKVEDTFQIYYEQIRKFAYINSLIRIYSVDFDKRVRKLRNRYSLILDQPVNDEAANTNTYKNIIPSELNQENYSSLREAVGNEPLYNALEILTDFQYLILELIYVYNLSKTEIAKLVETSPQNISNTHKKAIVKLKKEMVGAL